MLEAPIYIKKRTGIDGIPICVEEVDYTYHEENFGWICIALGGNGRGCNYDPITGRCYGKLKRPKIFAEPEEKVWPRDPTDHRQKIQDL